MAKYKKMYEEYLEVNGVTIVHTKSGDHMHDGSYERYCKFNDEGKKK